MKWRCPVCGTKNETLIGQRKVCSYCGHDEEQYELDDDDSNTRGYY